jgi:endonuclease YncB( thermonuclease family)
MFGWRRRSEGFEWQKYVRTTVLVRRADRQRKVDDVRMAALAKAKDTRDRGVAAGRAVADTVWQRIVAVVSAAARTCWRAMSIAAASAWSGFRSATRDVSTATTTFFANHMPSLPRPQWSRSNSAPGAVRRATKLLPDVGFRLPFNARTIGGAAAAVGLILVGGPMLSSSQGITTARLIPTVTAPKRESDLTGRATAVSGDLIRVNNQLIHLAGIEAPEPKQPCFKGNGKRWNCGASARTALEKIVRGKTVACTASGQDGDGRALASCRVNDVDISETLVRGGHVFAASGLFASYSTAESQAQSEQIGVWQGDTVRPKEWRAQIWEDAKRIAPEGCPIKGYARASDRVYTMPWSHDYHGAKVRTVKGDRWFCSEDEARAAGFKLSSQM